MSDLLIRGEVWWCGDDWCDCTQAQIVAYDMTKPYPFGNGTLLWNGTYCSSGWTEDVSKTELNRVGQAMRRHWHDAYVRVQWPWPTTEPEGDA